MDNLSIQVPNDLEILPLELYLKEILKQVQQNILVFCCHGTKYHYLCDFNNTLLLCPTLCGSDVWAWLSGFSDKDLSRLQCGCCQGLWSHLTPKSFSKCMQLVAEFISSQLLNSWCLGSSRLEAEWLFRKNQLSLLRAFTLLSQAYFRLN